MEPINVNYIETIFQQITSAHHFVDISHNILNLWVRLIFPKTRHLGFNLSTKMRRFWLELKKIWFSEFSSEKCYSAKGKTKVLDIWLAYHSHQLPNLMHWLSLNTEIGSRFMILFDPFSTFIKCHFIHIFSTTTI